jgi:hypothetical protein
MRMTIRRLAFLALVLAATALASAAPPVAASGTNCGFGFRCCPRLGHCLCWPDHQVCP